MKKVDQNECPCAPASGFYFLKSEFPVPKSLTEKYFSVTSILGNNTIEYVRWDSIKYKLNSRFEREKTTPFYTLRNINSDVHLYLYNDLDKEQLTIVDPFEDDLEAYNYPDCEGKVMHQCNPLDQKFVVDRELVPKILELTYDKLIKLRGMAPVDILNNQSADINTQFLK